MTAYFVTHPEVVIDPAVPVPNWRLSPEGLRRVREACRQPWLRGVGLVASSAERKAMEAAEIIAAHRGLRPAVVGELGENDRSATGYLPPAEFEAVADQFFAEPDRGVRGWETAADAQRRIVGAVGRVLAMAPPGDVAIVSHGGVGALLLCHLQRIPITRGADQPGAGGGHVYAFDGPGWRLLADWRRMEG